MQKKAIRIIAGVNYNDHTDPLFHQLNILKLNDIYHAEVAKIIYQFKQNTLPLPLKTLFITNREIYDRPTRQQHDLHLKKCRTTLATQHISSRGPHIWNNLPKDIKSVTSLNIKTFTKNIIAHFVRAYGT